MNKEIGGYFELELNKRQSFLHSDGICLNSGRNALEYILLAENIKRIWIPYYTCSVILEPLKKLNIIYSFYSINKELELEELFSLKQDEYILYTNYFGIKDSYIENLADFYKEKLIVDNAQALFAQHLPNIKTIYSPRKFVGVPDGGIAFTNHNLDISNLPVDKSYSRCLHLLKRHDEIAAAGYTDFKNNSKSLSMQPLSRMSNLTYALLSNIDYNNIKSKRLANFEQLHAQLGHINLFKNFNETSFSCPMVYPFLTNDKSLKNKLIANNIFVATYWPNVIEWSNPQSIEYKYTNLLLALPIDQRYDISDMEFITTIINNTL